MGTIWWRGGSSGCKPGGTDVLLPLNYGPVVSRRKSSTDPVHRSPFLVAEADSGVVRSGHRGMNTHTQCTLLPPITSLVMLWCICKQKKWGRKDGYYLHGKEGWPRDKFGFFRVQMTPHRLIHQGTTLTSAASLQVSGHGTFLIWDLLCQWAWTQNIHLSLSHTHRKKTQAHTRVWVWRLLFQYRYSLIVAIQC